MRRTLQPQSIRHLAFLLCLLSVVWTGCDQGPKVTEFKLKPQKKVAPPENSERENYPNLRISELGILAENALADNDIETVTAAVAEIRSRENIPGRVKNEIARILFGAGEMKDSVAVYDEILETFPSDKPQMWQRGLALYFADEFEKGVDQFESHQTFNSQDVENSVWHLLCKSRLTSVEEARKEMILIEHDSRVPMKQVFDMFAGSGSPEEVLKACGYDKDDIKPDGSIYHGLLYVGLFHEMIGDQEASNQSMIEALKYKPSMSGLMGHVAEGHLRTRKAYPTNGDAN